MARHVMVAMGPNDASENALEYALQEYPEARISIVHVTETSDPLGILGRRDPEDYMVPECTFSIDDDLLPNENPISRAQRKRAEYVFERACALVNEYDHDDVDLVVRSGKAIPEMADYAEAEDVDHIVVPDHNLTELRPLLRSVSQSVYRSTNIPVTIIA